MPGSLVGDMSTATRKSRIARAHRVAGLLRHAKPDEMLSYVATVKTGLALMADERRERALRDASRL